MTTTLPPIVRRPNEIFGTINVRVQITTDEDGDLYLAIEEIPGRVPLTTGDLDYIKHFGFHSVVTRTLWREALMEQLATRPNRRKE
jgi:hypothetical protein